MAAPAVATPKRDMKDWQTTAASWWCPGCGDFGVLAALQRALATLGYANEEVCVVSGIGCSGKISGYVKSYAYHSLHGRALPPAQAIKMANKDLKVIAVGGDGDGYGIGAGHFVHAARRNIDFTYIVMDNEIYGLTTGQASPTSLEGHVTKSTPFGVTEAPLNPVALSLAAGASFVARAFSGDVKNLEEILTQAIQHKGFAHVDVFSPCVTFNKLNTYTWFKERVYNIQTEGHDTSDLGAATQRALEWGDRIPYGVFYKAERPTYESREKPLQRHGHVTDSRPVADLSLIHI